MFYSFFNSLARLRYLSLFSHSFSFILWSAETAKSTILQIFLFLLIIIRSGLLAEFGWSVCISKSHRSLCMSFSRTGAGLCILLLLLLCSHPFFGLNVLIISGIKLLYRTLVQKYAEGKGPVVDSVSGSTTCGRGLLFPLLDSRQDWERMCLRLWLKLTDFSTLNFNFEKLNSSFFFLLLNSHWLRVAACYEGSGRYNSPSKSWIFLLGSQQDRERTCPWLCLKLTDFSTLNFNFEKLNSFFYFSTATESGCLLWRLWSWSICFGRYNSALKNWIPLFTSRQERAGVSNVAGAEIDWLWDFVVQLWKVKFTYSP